MNIYDYVNRKNKEQQDSLTTGKSSFQSILDTYSGKLSHLGTDLDNLRISIDTDQREFERLGKRLDALQYKLRQATGEEYKSLYNEYGRTVQEYNRVADKINVNIKKQDEAYGQYRETRGDYERDFLDFQRLIGSQAKERVSYEKQMEQPEPELTHEEKLLQKFTSTEDTSYWGGATQDPTRLAESKFGTLIKAVGTRRAIEQTFPEEVKHIGELKKDIYKSFEGETVDDSDIIAEIQSRLTGKPREEIRSELGEIIKQGNFGKLRRGEIPEYKEASNINKYIHSMDRAGLENDFIDALHSMSWAGLMMITGGQVLSTAWGIAPDLIDSIMTKNKVLSRDELWNIVERATGTAKDPQADKIFSDIIQDLEARGIRPADALAGKVDVSMRVPRFAFDTGKLYTGLPADEIAKTIIETGRIAADLIQGIDSTKVAQITQQLLNTAPAMATQFLEAVEKPEMLEKVPEGIQSIPKTDEPLHKHFVDRLGEVIPDESVREQIAGHMARGEDIPSQYLINQPEIIDVIRSEQQAGTYPQTVKPAIFPMREPEIDRALPEGLKPEVVEEPTEEIPKVIETPKEVVTEKPTTEKDILEKPEEIVSVLKPREVKPTIRKVTGQAPPEKIEVRERDILREVLRKQEKAAKEIFKKGKEEGIFETTETFEQRMKLIEEREDIKELRKEIREQEKIDKAEALKKSDTPVGVVETTKDARIYSGQVKPDTKVITMKEDELLKHFLRGEQKLAREVFKKGKDEGIFQQKERYYDVVTRAKERQQLSKEKEELRKIVKNINFKKLRPENQEKIKSIVEDIAPYKMTPRTKYKLQSRLDFLEEHPDHSIPEDKVRELERLEKKPITDMTSDEIALIKNSILHYLKLNEMKNKLILKKQLRDTEEVLKTARENILKGGKNLEGKLREDDDTNDVDTSSIDKESKVSRIWKADSLNAETVCEVLDFQDKGVIMQSVFLDLDKGLTEVMKIRNHFRDWFESEFGDIDISKWSKGFQKKKRNIKFDRIHLSAGITPGGKIVKSRVIIITPAEKITLGLHAKNKDSMRHLFEGGARMHDRIAKKFNLTEENLDEIINSITPEEEAVMNVFYRYYNSDDGIKPIVNKASVDINGFESFTEDNYIKIKVDEMDRKVDPHKIKQNFTHMSLEGSGMFKERTSAKNPIVIEDIFTVTLDHLNRSSSYVGLAKPLRTAKIILGDVKIQENILKNHGKSYLDNLKNYLEAVEGQFLDTKNLDSLAMDAMARIDLAVLGLNIFTILKQTISYYAATLEGLSWKYLQRALTTKPDWKEISKWSPQIGDRLRGRITREMGELSNIGQTREFFLGKSPASSVVVKGITKADTATVGRIWNAVKFETKDNFPELSGDAFFEKVAERTEEIVRRTQPSYYAKDRSPISRSPQIQWRWLTKFTTQLNKYRNLLYRARLRYDRSDRTAKDKYNYTRDAFKILVILPAMAQAIDEIRHRIYKRREKRNIWDFTIGTLTNALNQYYFVGDAFSAIESKVRKGSFAGHDAFGNPLYDWANEILEATAEIMKTVDTIMTQERYASGSKKGEEKWRTHVMGAIEKSVLASTKGMGLPLANVKKLTEGIIGIMLDREDDMVKPRPIVPK